jgi:hypothetical protein
VADLVRHPLVDEILDARVDFARGQNAAFEGYGNHAHRIQNFVRAIAPLSLEDQEKIAIAAAFHDLCAFDGLDYLEPSIEEAARYLRRRSVAARHCGAAAATCARPDRRLERPLRGGDDAA